VGNVVVLGGDDAEVVEAVDHGDESPMLVGVVHWDVGSVINLNVEVELTLDPTRVLVELSDLLALGGVALGVACFADETTEGLALLDGGAAIFTSAATSFDGGVFPTDRAEAIGRGLGSVGFAKGVAGIGVVLAVSTPSR
jgi:hypothetical protein